MCLPAKKIYAFLPQVSDKTEVGLLTTYNWQTSNVSLGLAGKYVMDDGAVMKVRTLSRLHLVIILPAPFPPHLNYRKQLSYLDSPVIVVLFSKTGISVVLGVLITCTCLELTANDRVWSFVSERGSVNFLQFYLSLLPPSLSFRRPR